MDLLHLIGQLAQHVPDEPENVCQDEYPHWRLRSVQAETQHRQYLVVGLRINEFGDVVLRLEELG